MAKKYFLEIEFLGTNYKGWQIQPDQPTVQQELETRLSQLCREKVAVQGAGRTDTGVHGRQILAHIIVNNPLPSDFLRRINFMLPHDIVIKRVLDVPEDAHARFSADYRRYKYFVHTNKNPLIFDYSYHLAYPDIDFEKMQKLGELLPKYTDFAALCKHSEQYAHTRCRMFHVKWVQMADKNRWYLDIKANRFLHNMVRRILGLSVAVGRGKISLEEVDKILSNPENRFEFNYTAPAKGLFLWEVGYPFEFKDAKL